jgi:hypothetical protein
MREPRRQLARDERPLSSGHKALRWFSNDSFRPHPQCAFVAELNRDIAVLERKKPRLQIASAPLQFVPNHAEE